jgi:hypothetical protein
MHKRTVEKDRGSSVSGKATFFLHNSFLLHSYILYWSCTSPVLVLYWSCTSPVLVLYWSCTGPVLNLTTS